MKTVIVRGGKKMTWINREQALSHPFANGQYDHEHANEHFIFGFEDYKEWLEQLPTADVVEQSVVDQIRWERDTAIAQLAEIGKGFGETMDDVVERKHGEWKEMTVIHKEEAKDIIEEWQSCRCSVCGRYDTRPYMYYFDKPNFCSWCGADMRKGESDG